MSVREVGVGGGIREIREGKSSERRELESIGPPVWKIGMKDYTFYNNDHLLPPECCINRGWGTRRYILTVIRETNIWPPSGVQSSSLFGGGGGDKGKA